MNKPDWVWWVVIGCGWLTGYLMGAASKASRREHRERQNLPVKMTGTITGTMRPRTHFDIKTVEAKGFDVLAEEQKARTIKLREKTYD